MTAYRKIRNLFVSELRAAERKYFSSLGRQLSSGSLGTHRWWKLAKRACGWSSQWHIASLSVNNVLTTDPCEKVKVLNLHFQEQCSSSPRASASLRVPSSTAHHSFEFVPVTAAAVSTSLSNLCCGKSVGPDSVPNELLKMAGVEIRPILAVLFNRSLIEGVFPSAWKKAFVSISSSQGGQRSCSAIFIPPNSTAEQHLEGV